MGGVVGSCHFEGVRRVGARVDGSHEPLRQVAEQGARHKIDHAVCAAGPVQQEFAPQLRVGEVTNGSTGAIRWRKLHAMVVVMVQ